MTAGSSARTMMGAFHWSLDVCALAIKRETQQRLVDGHPDLSARPLSERVAANQKDWISGLTRAANDAVAHDELRGDTDMATLVFELNALVIAANTAFILHDDPAVLSQARTAIERVILGVTPQVGESQEPPVRDESTR